MIVNNTRNQYVYETLPLVDRERIALEWLNRKGNLAVPSSRYGWNTESCAPVAFLVELVTESVSGDAMTRWSLDAAMGLVVNDDDYVHNLIMDHGSSDQIAAYQNLVD